MQIVSLKFFLRGETPAEGNLKSCGKTHDITVPFLISKFGVVGGGGVVRVSVFLDAILRLVMIIIDYLIFN